MSSSDYFGFGIACASGVLAFYLSDSDWAKNHHWLIPALWVSFALSMLLVVLRLRKTAAVEASRTDAGDRSTSQTVTGDNNVSTVVSSLGTVGAGAAINIGGHQTINAPSVTTTTGTRPKLTPLHYGQLGLGDQIVWAGYREALWIQNDGETANEVRVEPLAVGDWIVTFEGPVTITHGRGRVMVESIRKQEQSGGVNTTHLNHAWEDAYSTHGTIASVRLRVSYRDFHGTPYCSECSLQRDALVVGDSPFRVAGCADRPPQG